MNSICSNKNFLLTIYSLSKSLKIGSWMQHIVIIGLSIYFHGSFGCNINLKIMGLVGIYMVLLGKKKYINIAIIFKFCIQKKKFKLNFVTLAKRHYSNCKPFNIKLLILLKDHYYYTHLFKIYILSINQFID